MPLPFQCQERCPCNRSMPLCRRSCSEGAERDSQTSEEPTTPVRFADAMRTDPPHHSLAGGMGAADSLLLALVAREHALHRPRPALQFAFAGGGAHDRAEAVFESPVVGEFLWLGIDAGLKTGEIGRAERGGLLDHRAIDRRVEQI